MSNVVILGAASGIAQAVARQFAARGDGVFVVARDAARLDAIADDLRVRGARVVASLALDLTDHQRHPEIVAAAIDALGSVDTVLIAHGVLPDQAAVQADPALAVQTLDVNFLSVVSLCTLWANELEGQESGTLAVISSVAGDRGRQSNYVYGAAKAGLNAFLEGLRNRLFHVGVRVLTIKPGFVKTPMTAHLSGDGLLWAEPDAVAHGIVRAIDRGRDQVYVPGYWRLIMTIIRALPEPLFKRLRL